ncbi:MAG TPA: cell division protein FtsK [Syntrophomonas sp.]|jgi:S-DNA-T family DNA segregation ATPase FtsK/SpoIIIE|nr:cell division protein FtsK [Syntrophomonas sp.]
MAAKKKSTPRTRTVKVTAPAEPKSPGPIEHLKYDILSLVAFTLAVFAYVSLRKAQGLPDDSRIIGWLGTGIKAALEYAFGDGAVLGPLFILGWSAHLGINKKTWSTQMWGLSMLGLVGITLFAVYKTPSGMNAWEAGQASLGGGYLGGSMAYLLIQLVGNVGLGILALFGTLLGLLLLIDQPAATVFKRLQQGALQAKSRLDEVMFYQAAAEESGSKTVTAAPLIIDSAEASSPREERPPVPIVDIQQPLPVAAALADIEPVPPLQLIKTRPRQEEHYCLPPLELLNDVSNERLIDKKNIKESITVLEDTFASFGVAVKVNQVSCGPAVTRYELTPGAGVKISRIISLTDDLQLNLAAPGIRIEAPIPGKAAIGIEVPNRKILSVGLRSLISAPAFKKLKSPLAFALGEDISGNAVVARLHDMPHLLIAGSTGSGKSVCLNCIIMSMLYHSTPSELKMVFIDPKMVELTIYNGIPHLMTPVVTDPKKASLILRWMVREMEKRYQLFASSGARDIQRYNQISTDKLPYIVIVIDELADLMMVAPVDVEDAICRLAQMARAAGMHLIVATQRPSVDVVTGIIKANIPSRIAFAVSSQTDSRTILDAGGAEKLLGKGDMLFLPVGAAKPFRIQGAFVSDRDIEKTVDFIKAQFNLDEPVNEIEELELADNEEADGTDDELFWDALKIFVDGKKASVSLLQRRLRVGYARAARLVDIMEERGLISEQDSNKRREVLIDEEQFEKLYARNKLC